MRPPVARILTAPDSAMAKLRSLLTQPSAELTALVTTFRIAKALHSGNRSGEKVVDLEPRRFGVCKPAGGNKFGRHI